MRNGGRMGERIQEVGVYSELLKDPYLENSVIARMSGTPSEMARSDKLAAHPYCGIPDA
jgi:hypothetical protein